MQNCIIKALLLLTLLSSTLVFAESSKMLDPTISVESPEPQFILSAVAFAHNTFYCIINDKLFVAEDKIDGYKITKILINQVTLVADDNNIIILTIN